jgi:hypothetical protein
MAKKAIVKTRIKFGNKTVMAESNAFPRTGHIVYSGFGVHEDKARSASRRDRKIEEKRAKMGAWD